MKLTGASHWADLTLELIEATLTARGGDDAARQARALFERRRAELEEIDADTGHPDPQHVVDSRARVALLLLSDALFGQGEGGRLTGDAPADALVIGPDQAWFQLPGEDAVDIKRKRILRRLLGALVTHHQRHPEATLSAEELIRAGWPDQRNILNESAHNRLYVALNRLRNEGLGDLIQTERDGYRLAPDTPLFLAEP